MLNWFESWSSLKNQALRKKLWLKMLISYQILIISEKMSLKLIKYSVSFKFDILDIGIEFITKNIKIKIFNLYFSFINIQIIT